MLYKHQNSSMLLWILLIIICILLIFFYDIYITQNSLNLYNEIDNDNDTKLANNYLGYAKYKYKKNAIDNYRIGGIYDFVLHDTDTANDYYLQAINQIRNDFVDDIDDNNFVRDRLADRIRINLEAEEDDNVFQLQNLMNLNNELQNLELKVEQKIDSNTPIEEHITWKSDSQNVHDSNINNELRDNYKKIETYNKQNQLFLYNIDDTINYIQNVYSVNANEKYNIPDALEMLEYIRNHSGSISKIGVSERQFISEVFSRICYEKDTERKKNMMENLMLNLKESYGNGTPVCITGRTTRILSSFAGNDEDLGIFKSKPIIKNEIFSKAANIRNKLLNTTDDGIQKKYNHGIEDDDTKELEKHMRDEILHMIYLDYFKFVTEDKKFIDNIIDEINATL